MFSKSVFEIHIKLWKLCGCWFYGGDQTLWHKIYSSLTIAIAHALNPILMVTKVIVADDLSDRLVSISFITSSIGGLKSLMILRHWPIIKRLLQLLDRLDMLNCATTKQQSVIDCAIGRSKRLAKMFLVGYGLSTVYICIEPLLSTRRTLMWSMWVPFDLQQTSVYVYACTWLYQTVMTIYWVPTMGSVDAFASTMYIILTGHLKVLQTRLLALDGRRTLMMVSSKKVNNNKEDGAADEELRMCIKVHCICIE